MPESVPPLDKDDPWSQLQSDIKKPLDEEGAASFFDITEETDARDELGKEYLFRMLKACAGMVSSVAIAVADSMPECPGKTEDEREAWFDFMNEQCAKIMIELYEDSLRGPGAIKPNDRFAKDVQKVTATILYRLAARICRTLYDLVPKEHRS